MVGLTGLATTGLIVGLAVTGLLVGALVRLDVTGLSVGDFDGLGVSGLFVGALDGAQHVTAVTNCPGSAQLATPDDARTRNKVWFMMSILVILCQIQRNNCENLTSRSCC
jgi:hypothetical protein